MIITVPIKTSSKLNQRQHWAAKAKEARRERAATTLVLCCLDAPALPVTVTMTRLFDGVEQRELDDDNCAGALKCARDAIAAWLDVDDRDPRVSWVVRQAKTPPGTIGVRILIEVRA